MHNPFALVLFQPEIPGNTGSIGRTCLALNIPLILIRPYGFEISEKALRRAGLDYWKHVTLKEYDSWEHFLERHKPKKNQLYFMTKTANKTIFQTSYDKGSYFIFGSETKGLPPEILEKYKDNCLSLPMDQTHVRSLNLANCATTVAYEAFRQFN